MHRLSGPLGLAAGWLLLATALLAADLEQRQGGAAVRVRGDRVEDGQVKLRLSSALMLTLTVEGRHPLQLEGSDAAIEQAQLRALQAGGAWDRCEAGRAERARLPDGRERWRQTYRLDPLKPGEVKLQPAPLSYTEGAEEKAQEAVWQPIVVRITTEVAAADLKELRDIPPPEELPPVRHWWPLWLAGIALAMLTVGSILGAWELKRCLTGPPPLPLPHEWALGQLARIEALNLPASGQTERYHTLMSDVLRRYLEVRFQLPASKQTTPEFLASARSLPQLGQEQQTRLREFLERCDLAKFARVLPPPEECRATAALARALVEQTVPVAEEVNPGTEH
jgi:hypothetical protein